MAATDYATDPKAAAEFLRKVAIQRISPYDLWVQSTGVPVHTGYYIPDARTLELGPWEERGCNAAFLKLAGQEDVAETRITEIPPGKTLPPLNFAVDDVVYVVEGQGLAAVWAKDEKKRTFEWQKHSMFLLPRGYTHQLTNAQGSRPARLLHYNYLPVAMNAVPDPAFYFNNPYQGPDVLAALEDEFYSEARVVQPGEGVGAATGLDTGMSFWIGNFFPDLRAWDKLVPFHAVNRGASTAVYMRFPTTTLNAHMSVFPAQSYKKAHRHGPGVVIIIPEGRGFSVMWPEGKEKVFIPWQEASVFVPPNRWFHQHFNLTSQPARYLAFHSLAMGSPQERVENLALDQIEYTNEDPWIRQTFEAELAKHGLPTGMPEGAYRDPDYRWE